MTLIISASTHVKRLVFVRHAESLANRLGDDKFPADDPEKNSQILDLEDHQIPLSPRGKRQAVETGFFLASTFGQFDVILDSGYTRARQTREIAIEAGYPPIYQYEAMTRTCLLLRERDVGVTRKTTLNQRASIPYWNFLQKMFKDIPFFASPIDGESLVQCSDRAILFWLFVNHYYSNKTIICFSHCNFMKAIKCAILGMTPHEANMVASEIFGNCTIHEYFIRNGELIFKEYLPIREKYQI